MRIYVCIKHIPNTEVDLEISSKGDIVHAGAWIINPCDIHAITEAIKIREQHPNAEVIILNVGPTHATESIQKALAMGADRGIHFQVETTLEPIQTAQILAHIIKQTGEASLILTGKKSMDREACQTHFHLASELNLPVSNHITNIELKSDHVDIQQVNSPEEIGSYRIPLPCVLGVSKEINTPKHPSFMDIVKARAKSIQTMTPEGTIPYIKKTGVKILETKMMEKTRANTLWQETTDHTVKKLVHFFMQNNFI